MGLQDPASAIKKEESEDEKLDFYGDKEPQIADEDLEIEKEEAQLDQMIKEHKQEEPKPKIDVFNDPLLPEEDDFRGGSAKKRGRSGSFGGGGAQDELDSEEDIAFEDLDPDEKYQVLQHLYEEYQRDPDNFPEDQRLLLEQELKDLFD
jgi:hypothetical protein